MTQADILIVDDSAADRALMEMAFSDVDRNLHLRFASSGVLALELLRSEGVARPHMMIVDVKMPGLSGLELLQSVKSDPALRPITVIMFSGSDDQNDVSTAYSNFAAGYIRKPVDLEGLSAVAETVGKLCSLLVFPED